MSGGLITTRAASESHLGEEVAAQLLARSRPLAVAAGVLLAAGADSRPAEVRVPHRRRRCSALRRLRQPRRRCAAAPVEDAAPAAPPRTRPNAASPSIRSASKSATRSSRSSTRSRAARCSRACASIRKQIATETGMVVPPVHVADNLQLGPRTYAILVKGVEVARGELMPDRLLAINPGTATTAARRHRRRASRRSACRRSWIPSEQRDARDRRRLHGRRSDDGAVDAPVGDRSARSCRIS